MQVNQTNFLKNFFNFTLAKYEMLCYYIDTIKKLHLVYTILAITCGSYI